MIKVKEFIEFTHRLDGEYHPIDTQINDFLKDESLTLIDIKYQVVPNDNGDYSSALLIYKEDK
jgi:hypothetical protein